MNQTCSPTFNIVFIPGTVRYLRLAVLSLLDNSTCRYRLVSNGCSKSEQRFLQELCRDNPRLEFVVAAQSHVLTHGELLTRLQRKEESTQFAFMDSDVFASGDFMRELRPMMDSTDAIFSCRAIFTVEESQVMPRGYPMVHGEFNQYADGTCLGSSYFAIYDNALLKTCIEESGVTLRPYHWHEIPVSIQEELRDANMMVAFYDTGKLINILLTLRGYCCRFTQLQSLCHVGGFSTAARRPYRSHIKFRMIKMIPALRKLPSPILTLLRHIGLYNGTLDMLSPDERLFHLEQVIRRRAVGRHIGAFLKHIELGAKKPPAFAHDEPKLVDSVRQTEELLNDLYKRYGNDTDVRIRDEGATTNAPIEPVVSN